MSKADKLSKEDQEMLFKIRTNAAVLAEREGRLRAELALTSQQFQQADQQNQEISKRLSEKYSLLQGDQVDIDTGEIHRAATPAPSQEEPTLPPAPRSRKKAQTK